MSNFMIILLVTSAVIVTVCVCLLGLLLSRRRLQKTPPFKYPVPGEETVRETGRMLEDGEVVVYNIAEKRAGEQLERFKALMAEKKPYLNCKLSIEAVAVNLGTNKSTLSKLINERFGMNFRQLINSYRVKEAIDLYSNDNSLTMDELRAASGFNSVSTFTASFFRFTGCTPAEYFKKMSNR